MNPFEDNWSHATAVLNGRAQPRPPKETPLIPSLKEWGESNEGYAALSLLAAADREVCVGYSEEVMCMTTALVLKAEGMCSHRGKVGLSQAYAPEEPTSEIVSAEEAVQMAIAYNDDIENEDDLVMSLREALNEIAAEVNEKALAAIPA